MSESQAAPFEPLALEGFMGGLNTQASRAGVKDEEMAWCDGFMPIGEGNLRTIPGVGTPIFGGLPGGVTVRLFDFANIGFTAIMIVVTSDGAVWRTIIGGATAEVAPPGTISLPDRNQVGMKQWGSQFVILVANQPNGYFLIDLGTFYTPGSTAPDGTTVPTGIQGTAVETYQSRVWVTNGPDVFFSGPESYTDFSTANGGGSFASADSFLRVIYTKPVQTNGFLYFVADSSMNYISNVSTGGSPVVTTFTNQNTDPEIGTPYAGSVTVLGSNIVFANAWGAQVSYGGKVAKTSGPLDGVYTTAGGSFSSTLPSSAKCILFGKRLWVLLIPIIDPMTGTQVNKLFMWDEKRWWSTMQDVPLIYINSQELLSNQVAYGTDGYSIYPLFQVGSTAITKRVQSKLWAKPGGFMTAKASNRVWLVAQYFNANAPDIIFSVENETSGSAVTLTPGASPPGYPNFWVSPPTANGQVGNLLGITLITNAQDMSIVSAVIDAVPVGYRG